MKLDDARKRYEYFSGQASDISRQLGFAGIALIWVFKTRTGDQYRVPKALLPAAALIVLALIFDFLHYVVASLCWGIFRRVKERRGTKKDDCFLAPSAINWPSLFFFWAKLVAIMAAYGCILNFLVHRIAGS